jgi:hypothetical protein
MAAISSSTVVSIQSVTQTALQQLKVQQARQNAERAELAARSLRAQANAAQDEAERAQENARSLSVRSRQADSAAGQARQGVALIESTSQMQARLADIAGQVSERQADAATPAPPVVNTSGQVTGTVVNTTA